MRDKNWNPDPVDGTRQWVLNHPQYHDKELKSRESRSTCFFPSRTTKNKTAYQLLCAHYCISFSIIGHTLSIMQFLSGTGTETSCSEKPHSFGESYFPLRPIPLLVMLSVYWMPSMNAPLTDRKI
jgi:hypothetical protein